MSAAPSINGKDRIAAKNSRRGMSRQSGQLCNS